MHSSTDTKFSPDGRGCIALAAYRPNEELLGRQLRSIQAQSVTNFVCLIVADGDANAVAALVDRFVASDGRFRVIGADARVGFYRNFERVLAAVPRDADWVALSDQDDDWRPNKLEKMLPHLREVALVGAQARVVQYPSGVVVAETTNRQGSEPFALAVHNQFTGGMTVFRRSLLDTALPFPASESSAAAHDHWLAICALSAGGNRIIGDVVQDYVQHDANALGEAQTTGVLHAMRELSSRAGSATGTRVQRYSFAAYDVSAGWVRTMLTTLDARCSPTAVLPKELVALVSGRGAWWRAARALVAIRARRGVPLRDAGVYLIGAAARAFLSPDQRLFGSGGRAQDDGGG